MMLATSEECYSFASFRLFPNQRALVHNDEFLTVGSRAFDMLLLLVSNAGSVISVNDMMKNVWADISVDEANLRVQVGAIRKLLSRCDDAKRAIETIPLRGYCFVLPVLYRPSKISEDTSLSLVTLGVLPTLFSEPVGREEVIKVIIEAMKSRRLVTVTGPGGIGKTTVAIATASRIAATFDGQLAFTDLTSASDQATAIQRIAADLGLESNATDCDALCGVLSDRKALLILDTCEHIVDPVAMLVEKLLYRCPLLHILVTSREALRAAGEWTHRLASLTFPEAGQSIEATTISSYSAIKLFIERVHSASSYQIDDRDWALVIEICRRLDGIPLALEFAASRVADLGIEAVYRKLDDRFAILTRGRRTALPRHRTLSAALEWSLDLLSREEQRLLDHLAGLEGPFTFEAVIDAGLQCDCSQPLDTLASLYEKSLVSLHSRINPTSFRLMDTIRAYVASRTTIAH